MLILPVLVLIFIFSDSIILIILGQNFLRSANILILLSLMIFFAVTVVPYSALIEGINRPGVAGKLWFFMAIINIFLNLILIPRNLGTFKLFGLGAAGAALATLFSEIIISILFRIYAYKLAKITPYPRITLHLIAGILTGTILYIVKDVIVYHPIYIIPFGFFGLGCYFGLLYLMREFTKDDFCYLLDVISPKKLGGYIKEDIKK